MFPDNEAGIRGGRMNRRLVRTAPSRSIGPMHVNLFDHFQDRGTLIHHLDPRTKVVITVIAILSNLALPDGAWLAFGLTWTIVLCANLIAHVGLAYTFKRSFVALPFALAALAVVFSQPGPIAFTVALGPWELAATATGIIRFLSILLRGWLSVQMAILLTATTRFPDLLHGLRHLLVPRALVAIIAFMYRYLFVLGDEAHRLLRAREARSAQPQTAGSGPSLRWRTRVVGNMIGQLFLRGYERSDRVYAAMVARGYQGDFLTLNPHKVRVEDWLIGLSTLILLLTIQYVAHFVEIQ